MKHKKKALFQSLISLLLCFSMLVGTTFAWFTDGVSSGTNMIAAGNLDIEMEYLDADGSWKKVDENTEVLDKEALWEPGYTEVAYLKISNAGNLALKYALGIGVLAETGSVNIKGEDFKLSEHIRFGLVESEIPVTYADRITARNALTTSKAISEGYSTEYTLNQNGDIRYVALVVYMPEEVGNAANYATGATPPEIKLGIELVATQADYESDSFGTGYDTDAEMPGFSFPQNIFGDNTSSDVTTDDENKVAAGITIEGANTNAVIPAGVQLEEGTEKLTLEVTSMNQSGANVTLSENEAMRSLNVHVQGVSADNTVPMEIYIKEAAAKGLNAGNLKLYHVENGATVEMTAVDTFTAHNQFKYDPATGDITLYMATFSEIAVVAHTVNPWNGDVAAAFSGGSGTTADPYLIANADQLAYLNELVSSDNGAYNAASYKLLSDIVFAGETSNEKQVWYPIGYHAKGSGANKAGESVWYTYGGAFSGVFDGAGHKVSNIYQNTWIMDGNYDNGYWKEAMGLFGYVYGGTIKNLTIHNFYSEGEFAPTGCVAAYAANATFENIAITGSHPQTYNTSVAAVVGRDGKNGLNNNNNYNLVFRNITVDSTNTVSALWGSWDVGAAGVLGYLGSDSKVLLENCRVSPTIDVYNDVCGNYQYYWYRYCGMLIGTVDKTKADGSLDLSNITAKNCTVDFGDRHEYYYCEFVENSIASYTHDYQFSRVNNSDIVGSGENATCQGHDHEGQGKENIDGVEVLVEDKQAVYIPFRQIFGGYGWGVKGTEITEDGIEIDDITVDWTTEPDADGQVKFKSKFTGDFLYRVGNQNAVNVGTLFEPKGDAKINSSGVYVTITSQHDDDIIMGSFTEPTSDANMDGVTDWKDGQIKFDKDTTGIAKVTIQDYDYCTPTVLYVEVVDATNITTAQSSNGMDIVLLSDVKVSSNGTANYTNCTVYGNGFTFDVRGGMNQYNSKQGHGIIITKNATLDHLRIEGDVYDEYGMYTSTLTGGAQNDYTAAVDATNSTIQNCYIANCAAPIRSNGNTIIDTTLYGGTVANLLISGGTNTLTNVTTINYNDGRGVIGMGIVITDGASADSTKLILNGYLKQHNYVYETDVSAISVEEAKAVFNSMFENQFSSYHIGNNPKAVNTGIISINEDIKLNNAVFTDNADTNYLVDNDVTVTVSAQGISNTVNAAIASVPGSQGNVDNSYTDGKDSQGDYLPKFTVDLGTQMDSNDGADDTRYLVGDESGIQALYQNNESPITLDLTRLATATKYGQSLPVSVAYKDSDGKIIGNDATVELTSSGVLVFTVTDNLFYDANGNKINKTVERTYELPVILSVKEAAIKNAEITISKTNISGDYNSSKYMTFDPLEAITITDYDATGKGTTVTLDKNISSKTVEYSNTSSGAWGGATITITYTDGRVLTVHLGTSTLNSPGSSNGGKTITIQSDGSIKTDGKVANSSATGGTWTINGYSFKGNSGSTVTNNTKVTVTFEDESGCVTGDTLVNLADGTMKRIDEITYNDQLLVWNFFDGKYDEVPSAIIFYHGDENYRVLELKFSDGTKVKVINNHGFFDVAENAFVFIDEGNVENYIGHDFVKVAGNKRTNVELLGYEVYEEYTGCYSIQSAVHINFIVEDMFSLTIPPIEGWFDYFEIGNAMKYDEAKMQADIEKYGLYEYSDFAEYVTYEQFIAFNGPYLKVLVGRGVLTFEQILELIATYVN